MQTRGCSTSPKNGVVLLCVCESKHFAFGHLDLSLFICNACLPPCLSRCVFLCQTLLSRGPDLIKKALWDITTTIWIHIINVLHAHEAATHMLSRNIIYRCRACTNVPQHWHTGERVHLIRPLNITLDEPPSPHSMRCSHTEMIEYRCRGCVCALVHTSVRLPPSDHVTAANSLHLDFTTIRVKVLGAPRRTSELDSSDEGLLQSRGLMLALITPSSPPPPPPHHHHHHHLPIFTTITIITITPPQPGSNTAALS